MALSLTADYLMPQESNNPLCKYICTLTLIIITFLLFGLISYLKNQNFTPPPKLTVFIVPHSHCDVGWLYTAQEYFDHAVKHILNSVTDELTQHKNYKFTWAEV